MENMNRREFYTVGICKILYDLVFQEVRKDQLVVKAVAKPREGRSRVSTLLNETRSKQYRNDVQYQSSSARGFPSLLCPASTTLNKQLGFAKSTLSPIVQSCLGRVIISTGKALGQPALLLQSPLTQPIGLRLREAGSDFGGGEGSEKEFQSP